MDLIPIKLDWITLFEGAKLYYEELEKREPLPAATASRGGRFLKLPDIDPFQ